MKNLINYPNPLVKITLVIFVALLTTAVAYSQAGDTWTQKTDFGGAARWGATAFSIGSKGYFGTGRVQNNYTKDFWEYDPVTNAWTQKADFGGLGRHGAVGFSIGTKGYIGAGYDGSYKNDFWEYDPATNAWTQKANFGGVARYFAVGFSIDDKGYIGTGANGFCCPVNVLKDFWEYDPLTNSWAQKADFGGTARGYAAGFTVGSKGYIGTGANSGINLKDFWEYDPTSNTWGQKADFGGGVRALAAGFSIDNSGFIGTGNDGTDDKKDFWEYLPISNSWTQKADYGGDPLSYISGFSIDSKGYMCAGVPNNTNSSIKDFWEYTPECNGETFYADADGDGYGNSSNSLFIADCIAPSGYVYNNSDCNDANPSAHPTAEEVINCADDNCNGIIDEGKWIQKANFGGIARYNAAGFTINGKVYIGTGKTEANEYRKDFWQYDPATNVWTQKADFGGSKRYKATGFAIGTKGYIGTGYDLNGSLVKTFYEYDIATNTWTQKKAFGGTGRQSAVGFSIGSKGYIGTGGDFLNQHNDFWEYNPSNNTWTQKANVGSDVREAAVGFAIGTKGYIGTGYDGSYKNDFLEYDPASNSWTQKANFAGSARQGATGFSIDTKGYVGTGYDGAYKNDFWKYDPATDTWTQDADFTGVERAYAVGLSVSGKGYVGTGGGVGSSAYNDFREYNVPPPGLRVYADADDDGFGDLGNSILASGCLVPTGYVLDSSDCDDNSAAINPAAFPSLQWDKRYGGSNDDENSFLINTTDGGYLISGTSKSSISFEKTEANRDATNATNDYWILKTDASGVKQWDKTIGGTGEEKAEKMVQTADGGYLITGISYSNVGGDKTQAGKGLGDFWIVKVSSTGTIQWDKDFGGTGDEIIHMVIKTSDGGFLLGGESNSPVGGDKSQGTRGLTDYWIIKIDANGNKQWDKRFGGNKDDIINELRQTPDGGYLLAGRSFSGKTGDKTQSNRDASLATTDFWIVKIDGSGNYQWDKRYGGTAGEFLFDLQPTADYGYLLSGYSRSSIGGDKTMNSQGGSDYWVVKIDASGNKIYDAQYGGSADDNSFFLRITPDNGFVMCGQSLSGISGDKTQGSRGQRDYWLVKANSAGTKQWDSRYGGSLHDVTAALQLTPDGGLIIGGSSYSGITGDKSQDNHDGTLATRDFWIVKLSVNNGYQTFYPDADGDGYGASASPLLACVAPAGYITDNSDCNDNPASGGLIHPGATDVCNGIDDNCDGIIDENAITATITPSGAVSTCTGVAITLTANTGSGITYQWLSNNVNISGATNSTYSTSTAANYKVTESNSFGCTSTSAVTTLSVVAKPAATISYSTLDLCGQSSITLTANSGPGLTYQWLKANIAIAGATNQNYITTKKGSFKVVVTNSTGCSKTSPSVTVVKSCKEAAPYDELSSAEMKVYPNPTAGTFTLDLKFDSEQNTEAVIQVLNMTGQVMYDKTIIIVNGVLQKEILLPDAAADGMYLVKVTISDQVYSAQINYQK